MDEEPSELADARREIDNLRTALDGARVIGAAVGILVERHGLTYEAAFAVLAERSQQVNTKIRLVADELLFSGELPVRRLSSAS